MSRVLVVDTLNSMYLQFHWGEKQPLIKFIKDIRQLKVDFNIDRIVLCNDQGKSKYRSELHPEYKAPRHETREKQSEADKKRLQGIYDDVKKLVTEIGPALGMEVLQEWGVEADDQVACFTNTIDLNKHEQLNLSTDTDIFQLLRRNVVQRSYSNKMKFAGQPLPAKVWINRKKYVDAYGIEPWQYAHVKSCTGDKSDNIQGIFGLGDVNAFKLIREFETIDGVKENIGKILEVIPKFPKKVIPELENNFGIVEKAFKLINLNHDEETLRKIMSEQAIARVKTVCENLDEPPVISKDELEEYFMETGQINILADFDSFLAPFRGNYGF